MSHLGDSRAPAGPGYLPLQHHTFKDDGYDLEHRSSLLALRIATRLLPQSGGRGQRALGYHVYDPETVGDILGGLVWPRALGKAGGRPMPAWRFSWPVRVERPPARQARHNGLTFVASQQQAAETAGVLPIWDRTWRPDSRFGEISAALPQANGKPLCSRPAKGTFGIVLAANREDRQDELLFPIDPRLIAAHRGEPTLGSCVHDLKEGTEEIDEDLFGRLQTLTRVLRGPYSVCGQEFGRQPLPPTIVGPAPPAEGALAWHVGITGQGDGLGGLMSSGREQSQVYAHIARRFSGPIDLGPPGDEHRIGEDGDGNPINAAHISGLALFRFATGFDAPLHYDFELWPEPEPLPGVARVHFGLDPESGPWPFCTGARFGMHRWWAEIPDEESTDDPVIFTPGRPDDPRPPDRPGRKRQRPPAPPDHGGEVSPQPGAGEPLPPGAPRGPGRQGADGGPADGLPPEGFPPPVVPRRPGEFVDPGTGPGRFGGGGLPPDTVGPEEPLPVPGTGRPG